MSAVQNQLRRAMKAAENEHCSYCGKMAREVASLVTSDRPPYPCICDECVSLCLNLMSDPPTRMGRALQRSVRLANLRAGG